MKKLLLLLVLGITTYANATESKDTVVIDNAKKVTIITTDSLQKIEINGQVNNPDYRYTKTFQIADSNFVSTTAVNSNDWGFCLGGLVKSKERHQTEIISHLAVGFTAAPSAAEGIHEKPFSSWEIWWIIADANYRPWNNGHQFSAGVGIDWRNYRMTNRQRFIKSDDGVVSVADYPEDSDPKFSRIKVFSVNFPLRYHYYHNDFGFSVGPVLNLNTYGSIKTKYLLHGGEFKDVSKNIHQTRFTVDFMATIYLKEISFYVKYSPNNVLETIYGPKFKSLSFGIFL